MVHNCETAGEPSSPSESDGPSGCGDGEQEKTDNVGEALRSAYERTVNEDVPDELLELLGKLT